MTIPDYQSIMLPILKFAGDRKEHSIREAIEYIANIFNLTDCPLSHLPETPLHCIGRPYPLPMPVRYL